MPTLIQEYATAMMQEMALKAKAISHLKHNPTKGRYRELFVDAALSPMLSSQFGIGHGLIVNQRGDESNEQDIIIYDKRILPPFIARESLGVFPVESVVATIEVKSKMRFTDILDADRAAVRVKEIATSGTIYKTEVVPSAAIIGFDADDTLTTDCEQSRTFLDGLNRITAICTVDQYSWFKCPWSHEGRNGRFDETKRFVAVVLDYVRTKAERAYHVFGMQHRDWFSTYIRENSSGARKVAGETVEPLCSQPAENLD